MKKGIFITIEGGEACGKTTQINKLKEYFTQNNLDYVLTKEPGGMPLTDEIRNEAIALGIQDMYIPCTLTPDIMDPLPWLSEKDMETL